VDLTELANSSQELTRSPLSKFHFENAMNEVGPSLTDEMATLIELRKWDTIYGDNVKQKSKPGWGFANTMPDRSLN
jgi:hypothetical protein